ncbi:MAG: hypothetical protein HGA53_02855 [Anaerolineaceae bacterium]|nr:hypothetical protein [Anaerolineaceae bacterium]
MNKKLLLAYASRAGSTSEVVDRMAEDLRSAGLDVDVKRVQVVRSLQGYDAVVVGTPIRMYNPLKEAMKFASTFQPELQALPTACFSTGLAMQIDTPLNREAAEKFIAPLVALLQPKAVGLFPGKLEFANLDLPWRWIFGMSSKGKGEVVTGGNTMREGDYRDWEEMKTWALALPEKLF